MNGDMKVRLQSIQASMAESAKSCFSESEQDHLRCLIRLTVEIHDYLQNGIPGLQETMKAFEQRHGVDIRISPHELELKYIP
jgi:hypothetical protein